MQPKTTLCLRAEMLFPGVPPEVAFTCIADIRVRKQWDTRIESWNVIEKTDDYAIMHNKLMKVKVPFFTQRD